MNRVFKIRAKYHILISIAAIFTLSVPLGAVNEIITKGYIDLNATVGEGGHRKVWVIYIFCTTLAVYMWHVVFLYYLSYVARGNICIVDSEAINIGKTKIDFKEIEFFSITKEGNLLILNLNKKRIKIFIGWSFNGKSELIEILNNHGVPRVEK